MYSLLMPGAHARSPKPNWLTTILPVFKRPNHTYKKKKYLVVNLKLDLCNSAMPDERAIMTYVSSYYHCFAGKIKVNLAIHSTDHNRCRPYHFFIFTIFLFETSKRVLWLDNFSVVVLFFFLSGNCARWYQYTQHGLYLLFAFALFHVGSMRATVHDMCRVFWRVCDTETLRNTVSLTE